MALEVLLVGKVLDREIDFFEVASVAVDAAGAALFSAAFEVQYARSLAVHFDQFHLPAGVQMWCTSDLSASLSASPSNEAAAWVEGPYDR